jgi:hypothetical protein
MLSTYSETRWITNTLWVAPALERSVTDTDGPYHRLMVPSDLHAYKELRRRGLSPVEARSRISVSHGGPTIV